nr:13700_t:CDS:2 [Entrophospora candida]
MFAQIPQFKGLKIFHNRIDTIKQMTANEFHNLMKISVVVMDGVLKDSEKDCKITMRCIRRKEWAKLFIKLCFTFSPSNLQLPKCHSWLFHTDETIRQFGPLNGITTETYEALHKSYFKLSSQVHQLYLSEVKTFVEKSKQSSKLPIQSKVVLENLPTCLRNFINTFQKILLILCIKINTENHDVALIQWYDAKYNNTERSYKYGCPFFKKS